MLPNHMISFNISINIVIIDSLNDIIMNNVFKYETCYYVCINSI